ncbi:MAG: hypothetical protein HQ588_06505 [Deltaproteobacteria bacterium]|nr:hypothetical protein [Deltaproteobacteria bacterium]
MLKALKVILIIFGALTAVMGVMHIFAPGMLLGMMGLAVEDLPAACMPALYSMAMVGVSFIAGGVYLIVAGTRDIIRNIYWVQFAILWAILAVAGAVYSVIMGYVTFNQVMMPVITDAVFFILLMAFYPWGRTGD